MRKWLSLKIEVFGKIGAKRLSDASKTIHEILLLQLWEPSEMLVLPSLITTL